jgi:hypothetical protein
MNGKKIMAVVAVLALAVMACGVNINIPIENINTGPTRSQDIHVPLLEEADEIADVRLEFGAGELFLNPGAEGALISGTATFNVDDFNPDLTVSGNRVTISTGELEIRGIPNFGSNYKNEWNLELADAPMELMISAGAYRGEMELGGLALHSLEVSDGASDVQLEFSQVNSVPMDTLRYQTGASSVDLLGLANANFERMVFRGGAGEYSLDFSGDLQRDADVTIESGISSVTVIVPEGVSARVSLQGGLTNVDVSGAWERSGGAYSMAGDGPTITIDVEMGAGNLELRN